MAITASKKDNLVETVISEKNVSSEYQNLKPETQSGPIVEKPKGFLATTIDELKKVTWPKFGYVLRWSLIIVLFTAFFALTLGFFDHVFNNTIKYVDCTSPSGRNQSVNDCNSEFITNITFRS
jgi:preprotein translocase SecE subunit